MLQETLCYRRRFVTETFCYGDVLYGDVLPRRRFVWRRFVCAPDNKDHPWTTGGGLGRRSLEVGSPIIQAGGLKTKQWWDCVDLLISLRISKDCFFLFTKRSKDLKKIIVG
jgi:hypothetical protein